MPSILLHMISINKTSKNTPISLIKQNENFKNLQNSQISKRSVNESLVMAVILLHTL